MFKTIALIGLATVLAVPPKAAFAVNGNSSSYGSDGPGPTIPAQSLTPFDRAWSHNNQSKYEAENSAEWLRRHGKSPFPFF